MEYTRIYEYVCDLVQSQNVVPSPMKYGIHAK